VSGKSSIESPFPDPMTDEAAKRARLMNEMKAVIDELHRQRLAEVMAERRFNVHDMALAVIKAADGDVVPLRRP
jgi:hypothetical protein